MASLEKAVDDIYRCRLQNSATDTLNRVLKSGISDFDLAHLAIELREQERLVDKSDLSKSQKAQIICSLGLVAKP